MSLTDLKKQILEDGVVDSLEVETLRAAIYEDGIVDADELKLLVELRNEAKSVCAEFEHFFFEAAEKNLLADGIIDDDEVIWLREVIFADGGVDDREKQFLLSLKNKAQSLAPGFESLMKDCGITE